MDNLTSAQWIGFRDSRNALPPGVAEAVSTQTSEFNVLSDADNRRVWVSESVEGVLGYSSSDFLIRRIRSLIHPDDYERFTAAQSELMKVPGSQQRLQYRARHSDGTWRWVETDMSNLVDSAVINGIVSTTRDVTSRVVAKHRLSESERRLRSIVSSAGDVVVILDSARNVEYITPTVAVLLGRSTDTVKGEWMRFVHPADLPALGVLFKSALEQSGVPQGPVDIRMGRPDGTWLSLEMLITDFRADPIVRGVVLNARDVTSRRRVERDRLREQNVFNALVEMAPVGIFLADDRGSWSYANARVSKEFGIDSADLIGHGWEKLFDAADAVRLKSDLVRWDGIGRLVTELRTRGVPDAREVRVTITRPRMAGIVGTIEDVTSRRELDEMLIDGAALGSLAGVVGGAAHDIHNLLASIGFQLGLLDSQSDSERVSAANEAIDRACDITEDLMSISRPSRGRVGAIDLAPVVSGLAGMLGVLVEHQADLVVTSNGAGIVALADRTGLERVITNLVVNARDAMEPRGHIDLSIASVQLDELSTPPNGAAGAYATISVKDDGCGIPDSLIERIFEPYFTTKADGNGIGLAASRRNVRSWGGDITVSSVPGKGTTVTVVLPLASNLA